MQTEEEEEEDKGSSSEEEKQARSSSASDDEQDNGFEEAPLVPVGNVGDLHREVSFLQEKAAKQEQKRWEEETFEQEVRVRGLVEGATVRVLSEWKEDRTRWQGAWACQEVLGSGGRKKKKSRDPIWEEILPFSLVVVTETWSGDEDDRVKVSGDRLSPRGIL